MKAINVETFMPKKSFDAGELLKELDHPKSNKLKSLKVAKWKKDDEGWMKIDEGWTRPKGLLDPKLRDEMITQF